VVVTLFLQQHSLYDALYLWTLIEDNVKIIKLNSDFLCCCLYYYLTAIIVHNILCLSHVAHVSQCFRLPAVQDRFCMLLLTSYQFGLISDSAPSFVYCPICMLPTWLPWPAHMFCMVCSAIILLLGYIQAKLPASSKSLVLVRLSVNIYTHTDLCKWQWLQKDVCIYILFLYLCFE
jgi:hypothetical protein